MRAYILGYFIHTSVYILSGNCSQPVIASDPQGAWQSDLQSRPEAEPKDLIV